MNVLFLTVSRIADINSRGIYTDLIRKFRDEGHHVYIVSPLERRFNGNTSLTEQESIHLLKVKTLNIQKTNVIEKGFGTLLLEYQFTNAVKKYLCDVKFDLILYSTPPITLSKVIRHVKKRCDAVTYLMLKDIFPQNAVDLGMFSHKGILYRMFRSKEKKMYSLSDYIGCMSPANVAYLLSHNPEITSSKVEICPNAVELTTYLDIDILAVRQKYNIPEAVTTFVYGGNLGKPQGVDFLLKVLESNINKQDRFFVVVGSGTEFIKIKRWLYSNQPINIILFESLPKQEYDLLLQSCDVGLIFLDSRFTIPNYPSRLLSYMEYKMPIIAATDANTDIGTIAEDNRYGFSCISGDLGLFNSYIDQLTSQEDLRKEMGENGYDFLLKNYTVQQSYNIINSHF